MKKFFIAIVALAAAVSCSNDDIISIDRQAIGFGNPFVENATRAAIDASYSGTKSLTTFYVYGTLTGKLTGYQNTVNVFDGATCTGQVGDDIWGCTQTEYWVPNCNYNFTALVDVNTADVAKDTNNMPTGFTVTSDGVKDVLLATAVSETDADGVPTVNPVAFTFKHLLSKAYFTFENTLSSTNYTFKVSNVAISNIYTEGTYTIGATTPWVASVVSTTPLSFGENAVYEDSADAIEAGKSATSNYARTLIPAVYGADNKFKVTFDVVTVYKGTEIGKKSHAIDVEHTFVAGYAYNFVAKLGAENKITFTVNEVDNWAQQPDLDIP